MLKKSMVRINLVVACTAALLLGLSGVAHADAWEEYARSVERSGWDPAAYPDCGEALAKVYWSGAMGGVGGPAGVVAGAAKGLPDVYFDCPTLEPWQQNGT